MSHLVLTRREDEDHGCDKSQTEHLKSNELCIQRGEERIEEVQKPPRDVHRHRNWKQNRTEHTPVSLMSTIEGSSDQPLMNFLETQLVNTEWTA